VVIVPPLTPRTNGYALGTDGCSSLLDDPKHAAIAPQLRIKPLFRSQPALLYQLQKRPLGGHLRAADVLGELCPGEIPRLSLPCDAAPSHDLVK
jgi:hypothetical protein